MSKRERPSTTMLQQVARVLVNEPGWRDHVTSWLLPVYYEVTPDDIAVIEKWRSSYQLKSWRVGKYSAKSRKSLYKLKIITRFGKWGGDLRKSSKTVNNWVNERKRLNG